MSISLQSIDFVWPNGHELFKNLKLNLDQTQKHGLVGHNGVGKSTLVNLILGQEKPKSGVISLTSSVSIFQQSEKPKDISVGEYLIDLWTQVNLSEKSLVASLIEDLDMESNCQNLSGGEWTKCRLLKVLAEGNAFIIFDEPTNHLDQKSKELIFEFIQKTNKGLLIISHDRQLLQLVDLIHELSNQGITTYGGGWEYYHQEHLAEDQRLSYEYDKAQREKKKSKLDQQEKLQKQEKRMRSGKKYADSGSAPKILMNRRKGKAENTMGDVSRQTRKINEKKNQEFDQVVVRFKLNLQMYAQLTQPDVNDSKMIFEAKGLNFKSKTTGMDLWTGSLNFIVRGPQKISIRGSNGSGKTTFLKAIVNRESKHWMKQGELKVGLLKIIYIDQQYEDLDLSKTVLETIYENAGLSLDEIRNQLAMFLFQDEKVNQKLQTLSGGEKLRLALAKAFIQKDAPELIIMDEPTNNLDIKNLEFLEGLLKEYKGALIVVSHDHFFVDQIGVSQMINLDEF